MLLKSAWNSPKIYGDILKNGQISWKLHDSLKNCVKFSKKLSEILLKIERNSLKNYEKFFSKLYEILLKTK